MGVCNAPSVLCWIALFKKEKKKKGSDPYSHNCLASSKLPSTKKTMNIDHIHNDCHFYMSVHYLLIPFIKTKSHSQKKKGKTKASQVWELLSTWKSFLKFCERFYYCVVEGTVAAPPLDCNSKVQILGNMFSCNAARPTVQVMTN